MAIEIIQEEGFRFRIQSGKHVIISDQPEPGGTDKGMTPVEMLAGSLGACIGVFINSYAQRHEIDLKGMKISVNMEPRDKPHRMGYFSINVNLPKNVPEMIMPTLQKVAETCTVHNSMSHAPEIIIKINNPK
jgi:putative redox protein